MKENKAFCVACLVVVGILLIVLLIFAILLLSLVLNDKFQKSPDHIKPAPVTPGPLPTHIPGKCNDPNNRHGILIGFDGTRQDAFRLAIQRCRQAGNCSNFLSLIDNGAVSYRTYAGGHFYDSTRQVTMSGPGWTSVLTGVWQDLHKVTNNHVRTFSRKVPTIFNYVKERFPTSKTVACVDWDQLEYLTNASYMGKPVDQLTSYSIPNCAATPNKPLCKTPDPELAAYIQNDVKCVDDIAAVLSSNSSARFIFLYIGAIDETGHSYGFSPNDSIFMAAITKAIGQINSLMAQINARRQKGECWLVGIVNDHGGHNSTHGSQSWTDREITSVFQDPTDFRYSGGKVLSATHGHTTTTPTFLDYFGISQSQYPLIYDRPINKAPNRSLFVTTDLVPRPQTSKGLQVGIGMPQPTTAMFPGLRESFLANLSAAMVSLDQTKLFFFTLSGWYIRFDVRSNTADPGFPRRIAWDWKGLVPMITAAVSSRQGMEYYFFLNNGSYIRHRLGTPTIKSIATDWPGVESFASQLLDVHVANHTRNADNNIRYQFLLRGGNFFLYNFSTKKIEGRIQNLNNFIAGIVPYSDSIVGALLHPTQPAYYYFLKTAPYN